jgi:hypothetical protein
MAAFAMAAWAQTVLADVPTAGEAFVDWSEKHPSKQQLPVAEGLAAALSSILPCRGVKARKRACTDYRDMPFTWRRLYGDGRSNANVAVVSGRRPKPGNLLLFRRRIAIFVGFGMLLISTLLMAVCSWGRRLRSRGCTWVLSIAGCLWLEVKSSWQVAIRPGRGLRSSSS